MAIPLGALALLGIFFLSGYLWPQPYAEASSIGKGVASFDELAERFTKLAQSKGASYAYEILRQAPLPPQTDIHLLGHIVGDELYLQKGVDGIAECTQDFRNACSHAVVVGALQEYGANDETLTLIDDACKKAPGGSGAYTMCYHGLGHGVLAFFAYDLAPTVAFCKRMGTPAYGDEQYIQCVGGAIMELMGGGGHDQEHWLAARKKYLTDDPLSPCDLAVIPDDAKSYCYIYHTPRLLQMAGGELALPSPTIFPTAFSYCEAIPTTQQRWRDSCFGGFGKEFVPLAGMRDIRKVDAFDNESYRMAAEWCLLARPQDGKEACIAEGLKSVFWGGENDPAASLRFCAVVPTSVQSACYATFVEEAKRYLSAERLGEWCKAMPIEHQSLCQTL